MPIEEEVLAEIVFDVFLKWYNYPGAAINYLIFKSDKPFKAVVRQHYRVNLILSTLLYGIMLLLITS